MLSPPLLTSACSFLVAPLDLDVASAPGRAGRILQEEEHVSIKSPPVTSASPLAGRTAAASSKRWRRNGVIMVAALNLKPGEQTTLKTESTCKTTDNGH
jgi:hypothetical protein